MQSWSLNNSPSHGYRTMPYKKGPSSIVSTRSSVSMQRLEESIQEANLTLEEQRQLSSVLSRDRELSHRDKQRVSSLERDLSMKKYQVRCSKTASDGNRCQLCGTSLQLLIHPGYECMQCGMEFCKKCVIIKGFGITRNSLCTVCHQERLTSIKKGEWFITDDADPEDHPDVWKEGLHNYLAELQQNFLKSSSQPSSMNEDQDPLEGCSKRASVQYNEVAPYTNEKENGSVRTLKSTGLARNVGHNSMGNIKNPPPQRSNSRGSSVSFALNNNNSAGRIRKNRHEMEMMSDDENLNSHPNISTVRSNLRRSADHVDYSFDDDMMSQSSHQSRKSVHSSMLSIYSENEESFSPSLLISGEIMVRLDYDFRKQVFVVFIRECRHLAAFDIKKQRSNPYVKCYLLPDRTRGGKRKTVTKKKTLNPQFNETLTYNISKADLEIRTVHLSVWHNQSVGHNIFLGQVLIPLTYYKFSDTLAQWFKLEEKKHVEVPLPLLLYKGDLLISIKYVPQTDVRETSKKSVLPSKPRVPSPASHAGQILVHVKEAKNLSGSRSDGISDTFVKGFFLPDKSKQNRQKTPIVKRSNDPSWKYMFRFQNVSKEDLHHRSLELTVWHSAKFASHGFLGGVRLNLGTGASYEQRVPWMDARDKEVTVWQQMIQKPNVWINATLPLRSNMD